MLFTVCLVGVDGSGKSGHLRELRKRFDKKSIVKISHARVAVFRLVTWPMLRLCMLLGYKIESGHPYTSNMVVRRVWPWLFFLDYLIFLLADNVIFHIKRLFKRENDFIWLLDRYYYDGLVDWACAINADNFLESRSSRLFRRVLPRPDVTILLDISLENALKRKKDEHINPSYLTDRLTMYHILADLLKIPVVDANRSFTEVHGDILRVTCSNSKARAAFNGNQEWK